jgi:transcriptional regulator with XRE-family HTH domain
MSKRNYSAQPSPLNAAKRRQNRLSARAKEPGFGDVIRRKRRELELTQEEVALRLKTSTPYVGHLESGKRHPSDKIVTRLAEVLGLDSRKLFFLANPHTQALLAPQPENTEGSVSGWDQFRNNEQLRRIHNVSNAEMEMLSQVALLGGVSSPRDLIFILNTVRHAVGR